MHIWANNRGCLLCKKVVFSCGPRHREKLLDPGPSGVGLGMLAGYLAQNIEVYAVPLTRYSTSHLVGQRAAAT